MTDGSPRWMSSLKAWGPWMLVLGALGFVFGPTLAAHVIRGFDPYIFNDDNCPWKL